MARARKTVNVVDLIDEVNRKNRWSTCSREHREGWNSLLESILHMTDAYAGFGFLKTEDLKGEAAGKAPGIIPNHHGEGMHAFPDETRRVYYIHNTLKPSEAIA